MKKIYLGATRGQIFFPHRQIPRRVCSLGSADWRQWISLVSRSQIYVLLRLLSVSRAQRKLYPFKMSGQTSACHCAAPECFCFQVQVTYRYVSIFLCCTVITWSLLVLSAPDLWPLASVNVSDPPLTFTHQTLRVCCCEMKATLTSHSGLPCFPSLGLACGHFS